MGFNLRKTVVQGLVQVMKPTTAKQLIYEAKRLKLPLRLNKQKKKVLSLSSQFNTTLSDAEIEKSLKGYIPKNTS